jgi:hypothetical protein
VQRLDLRDLRHYRPALLRKQGLPRRRLDLRGDGQLRRVRFQRLRLLRRQHLRRQ